MKTLKVSTIFVAVVCLFLFIYSSFPTEFAAAETSSEEYTLELYANDFVFYTDTSLDGKFTLPVDLPATENHEFKGWSDGFLIYQPGAQVTFGKRYQKLNAVFEEIPTEKLYPRISPWEIAGWSILGVVLLSAIAFTYYWCGIKERRIRDIPKYLKRKKK